jgi:hypothetical protein
MRMCVYVSWIMSVCMYVCRGGVYIHKGDSEHGPKLCLHPVGHDTIQNRHLNINPAKVKHAVICGSVRIMNVCMYACMYVCINNNWTLIDEHYATRCAESSETKVCVLSVCMYV